MANLYKCITMYKIYIDMVIFWMGLCSLVVSKGARCAIRSRCIPNEISKNPVRPKSKSANFERAIHAVLRFDTAVK